MDSLHWGLKRAIELAMDGKLREAQATLDELDDPLASQLRDFLAQQQQRESERAAAMAAARHDIGNALSIAKSSVEGMIDSVVHISDKRLVRIRDILASVSDSMYRLTAQSEVASVPRVTGDPIEAEITALAALTQSKDVVLSYEPKNTRRALRAFRADPDSATRALRRALLMTVRYAPPGSVIGVSCSRKGDLALRVDSADVAINLLEAFDGSARFVDDGGIQSTVLISL